MYFKATIIEKIVGTFDATYCNYPGADREDVLGNALC